VKYLIIGLGNPGAQYEGTRHNIGFNILDSFVKLSETSFSTAKLADVAEVKYKGRKLILIKPNTFMNLSGKAVAYWIQKSKIAVENILVVTDDLSLSLGALRLRGRGSDGGHNGLKDIQKVLATSNYSRLRFGIGNNFRKGNQAEYVLSHFDDAEYKIVQNQIDLSMNIIYSFVTKGLDLTMSEFNRK